MDNQNLGVVISNDKARKIIYGIYAIAVVVVGAVQVYYSAVHLNQPDWLTGSLAVLAYLGAPIGALAAANAGTRSAPVTRPDTQSTSPYLGTPVSSTVPPNGITVNN